MAGALSAGAKSVFRLIAGRDSRGDVRVLGCENVLGRERLGCEELSAERPNLGADGDVERDSKGDVRVLGCENVLGCEKVSPERPNLGVDGDENRGSAGDENRGSLKERVTAGA